MSLRIITGEFRRRKLRTNAGLVTRPITDRMKETVFELLGDFGGHRAADVFAGTGTMGLEAISRGAVSAVFFEHDRKAFELLRENAAAVGAGRRAFAWRVDVRRTSFRPRGLDAMLPYSRIFFDPPYAMAPLLAPGGVLALAMRRLAKPGVSAVDADMVLRVPRELTVDVPAPWEEYDRLEISSSRILFCKKTDEPKNPPPVD